MIRGEEKTIPAVGLVQSPGFPAVHAVFMQTYGACDGIEGPRPHTSPTQEPCLQSCAGQHAGDCSPSRMTWHCLGPKLPKSSGTALQWQLALSAGSRMPIQEPAVASQKCFASSPPDCARINATFCSPGSANMYLHVIAQLTANMKI